MPKNKEPNFVFESPSLFALNRAARRKALRDGTQFISVPMPCLHVTGKKTGNRVYTMVHAHGEHVPYTPYYNERKQPPEGSGEALQGVTSQERDSSSQPGAD